MLPLLRVQQRVEAQTAKSIPDQVNPYLQEELMSGRVGAEIEHFTDTHVQPLFDALKRDGVVELAEKRRIVVPNFDRLAEETGDDSDGGFLS